MDNRPIGIFDSGLGGLTVLKEMIKLMPDENMIYFGDCGRVPYGTKSKETVIKYTMQDIDFLMSKNVKMIVMACNTASAWSYEIVKSKFAIPVVEVITPGLNAAIEKTKNKRIGIIGTNATISSGAYEKGIKDMDSEITVYSRACPLFVPLAEEGCWDSDITLMVAEEYLESLRENDIDTLILGCTHYPLLKNIITKVLGNQVNLINSGYEVAVVVKSLLNDLGIFADSDISKKYEFFTSDSIEKLEQLGSKFLERKIDSASKVEIEKF